MTFPFNFFEEKNQETLNSNPEPAEKEVQELSKKIKTQIQRENAEIKSRDYFITKRKLDESFNSLPSDNSDWEFKKANFDQLINDLSQTIQSHTIESSTPESTPPFSTPSQIFEYKQRLIRIEQEYLDYLTQDEPFLSEFFQQPSLNLSITQKKTIFQQVVQILITPVRLVSGKTTYLIKHIPKFVGISLMRLLVVYAVYLIIRSIYWFVTWLLRLAFRALPKKNSSKTAKSKKDKENEVDEIEESKKFWGQHMGWWSKVIKINRGGHLISLEEANIYEFSTFDQEQALLFVSPIMYSIKFQKYWLELNELLGKRQRSWTPRKYSFRKFKKLKSKVGPIILGILILLSTSNGTPIPNRTRNFSQLEIGVLSQPVVTSVLPLSNVPMDKLTEKDESKIYSIESNTKELLKTTESIPSQLTPVKRGRKRAKLVRLSDLPPLPDYSSDFDSYSLPTPRRTDIKVR